jgi:hypothetical protein
MGWPSGSADLAFSASSVDLPDYPAPFPLFPSWGLFHDANEFMARDSTEVHIAFDQFQIGVADASRSDPDQGFTRSGHRLRPIFFQSQYLIKNQGLHPYFSFWVGSDHLGIPASRYYSKKRKGNEFSFIPLSGYQTVLND